MQLAIANNNSIPSRNPMPDRESVSSKRRRTQQRGIALPVHLERDRCNKAWGQWSYSQLVVLLGLHLPEPCQIRRRDRCLEKSDIKPDNSMVSTHTNWATDGNHLKMTTLEFPCQSGVCCRMGGTFEIKDLTICTESAHWCRMRVRISLEAVPNPPGKTGPKLILFVLKVFFWFQPGWENGGGVKMRWRGIWWGLCRFWFRRSSYWFVWRFIGNPRHRHAVKHNGRVAVDRPLPPVATLYPR